MANKKQPAKKRAYKKRKNIAPVEKETPNQLVPAVITNKDTEIEQLTVICSMMDNFTTEQKQRILKFLCGRYYDFL